MSENIHRKGAQTWTPQKENNAEQRVLFWNNDTTIAWKYIDLRSSAAWRFSKSEQLPEDGQVRPKHVAIDVLN
jgi:hypothetical protein